MEQQRAACSDLKDWLFFSCERLNDLFFHFSLSLKTENMGKKKKATKHEEVVEEETPAAEETVAAAAAAAEPTEHEEGEEEVEADPRYPLHVTYCPGLC